MGNGPIARRDAAISGMAEGTPVQTLSGVVPVERLRAGDRVLTRAGMRRIAEVEALVLLDAPVVRVAANVLGQGRPETTVLLAPATPILIRDWRAKALFGAAQALVPVSRLIDGEYIRMEQAARLRLYRLTLDGAAVIYAGGLELACDGATVAA